MPSMSSMYSPCTRFIDMHGRWSILTDGLRVGQKRHIVRPVVNHDVFQKQKQRKRGTLRVMAYIVTIEKLNALRSLRSTLLYVRNLNVYLNDMIFVLCGGSSERGSPHRTRSPRRWSRWSPFVSTLSFGCLAERVGHGYQTLPT